MTFIRDNFSLSVRMPCNYSARSVCSQSSIVLIYSVKIDSMKYVHLFRCFSSFSHTEMEHFKLGRNRNKLKQIWIPVVRWHSEDLWWWDRKLSCFLLTRNTHDHNEITHISHIALPLLNGNLSILYWLSDYFKPHSF